MAVITDKQAKAIKPDSKAIAHGGVTGLYLHPSTTKGAGKWLLRYTSPTTGKRRDMGLGLYPEVSIARAGDIGRDARRNIEEGLDPIEYRKTLREAARIESERLQWTFEKAARQVHEDLKPGWKNEKHVAQWINTLETYIFPKIGKKPIEQISPKDCADALRPIWLGKPETASRTRQRMHAVMAWAWAHGYVQANPLDVVDHLLPKQDGRDREHQPAMPWREVPAFIKTNLAERLPGESTKAALEFLILTAARSGEVRGMQWSEIDFDAKLWAVPAERMKAGVMHRVPLSDRAIEILEHQRANCMHETLIFPSPRGKALSDMVFTELLRRVKAESTTPERTATAHGFRSSFRDWASVHGFARDLAERALAHTIANKVEAAYHRTDLLDQRRPMMVAWADFLYATSLPESVGSSKAA